MKSNHVKMLVSSNFSFKEINKSPLKSVRKKHFKTPTCQWCSSSEIRLVPVSSLVNLKPQETPRYQKLWQERG
jgi:2-hydroxy-3-keto-5-methylthiopentenyl-1-phosphate phosphatase